MPKGSFLIIENLDRLSREHIQPALLLVLTLLQAGIRIVQLKPSEIVFDDKSDTLPVMMMMVELSRGHSESAMKSDRIGKAWVTKRKRAREQGELLTRRLPAWVEEQGGKLCLRPGPAAAVRRVFQLAAVGYGCTLILKRLEAEGVPSFADAPRWSRSYIGILLNDRRVLGEYQPRLIDGKPDGDPIPGYYPAVLSEQEWNAVRAAVAGRREKPGRVGKRVSLFAGLLQDARGGGSYVELTRSSRARSGERTGYHVALVSAASLAGRSPAWSFPALDFERAILSKLAEIDPHDILNGDSGLDESLVLAGQLEQVESSIALITADLDEHGESPVLFRRLRAKEAEKKDLAAKLVDAQQRAANPLSASWGECQSLLATLDAAPDPHDARLRLRSALRRIIESVCVLVVPHRPAHRDRLAAVQVWFAGGQRQRSYLILHRPPRANAAARVEGQWWVRSFAEAAVASDLDLRKRKDAKELERALAAVDLSSPGE